MISAEILDQFELDAENRSVLLRGNLIVVDVAAAVNRAHEIFTAPFDPLHRLSDLHGHEAHESLFGMDIQLASEAAAHFRRHDAETVLLNAEHLRNERAHEMWDLGRRVER